MRAKKKITPRASSKARVDVPTRDGWVRRHWGQEVPSYEKLQEAIAALDPDYAGLGTFRVPLDQTMRRYIATVLDFFYVGMLGEEQRHQPGRPEDFQMLWAAQMAIELVDRYDVLAKVAIGSMLKPDADPKLFGRLSRRYSKLRKSGGYRLRPIERLIEEAAQRLPAGTKKK